MQYLKDIVFKCKLIYNENGTESGNMYRVKEGIIGSAIGDALGCSTKGQDREYLLDNPILKMYPNIKKGIPRGSWGESTSLMIATMCAISKRGLDYDFIAENCVSWFTANKYCSVREAFGIGETTLKSLVRFTQRQLPAYECGETDVKSNGNSSLKMMLPLAYYFTAKKSLKDEVYDVVKKVCSITHKNELCVCACYIYVHLIMLILNGNNKYAALKKLKLLDYSMFSNKTLEYFSRILIGNIQELELEEIDSSSFIVSTLESALWCFSKSESFKDCVIAAANLGKDTSTIGSLSGTLAGIYYGTNKIPSSWDESLRKKEYLTEISEEYETYLRNLSYK